MNCAAVDRSIDWNNIRRGFDREKCEIFTSIQKIKSKQKRGTFLILLSRFLGRRQSSDIEPRQEGKFGMRFDPFTCGISIVSGLVVAL